VFAGGGSARLATSSAVRDAELVVAVDVDDGARGGAVIRLASAIEPEWLLEHFAQSIDERSDLRFNPQTERVERVTRLAYDGLVLDESRSADVYGHDVALVLAEAVRTAGVDAFCGKDALDALARRILFAAPYIEGLVPITDDSLRTTLDALCEDRRSFDELRSVSMLDAIRERHVGQHRNALERVAPETVVLPNRRRTPVHYERDRPPWIASRLQDFFGLREGPSIADGRVPLVLHLLAPNQRAVQVTTDLAGFWDRHYPGIRKELMRRYPRHAWPDDPRAS